MYVCAAPYKVVGLANRKKVNGELTKREQNAGEFITTAGPGYLVVCLLNFRARRLN